MIKKITFPFNLSGKIAIRFTQLVQELVLNPIQIGSVERKANAKSLLGILSLNILRGDAISIFYEEEGDFKVIEEIIHLIKEEK